MSALRVVVGSLLLASCALPPTPQAYPPKGGDPAAKSAAPAAVAPAEPSPVTYTFAHGSEDEKGTAAQLDRLLREHDLGPWLYTKAIAIDSEAIPHSHPTLTLHTRHAKDDLLLLSTFIHEQSHRYVEEHPADLDAAVKELRAVAPGMPVGYPDGADNEVSDYEHFVVIALEERGLIRLVGELEARQAMTFWSGDHYRTIYRTYLDKHRDVWRIMDAHHLASPGESPRAP